MMSVIMTISKVALFLTAGIHLVAAQNFWDFFHEQRPIPHFYNGASLLIDPSRLHTFGSAGIPKVRPDEDFNAKENRDNTIQIVPVDINLEDYLLYRQRITPRNPFEIYRQRALRRQELVMRHARTQGVIMAEQYLSHFGSTNDQTCTQRSFCDIACIDESSAAFKTETSTAAGEAIRVMEKMIDIAYANGRSRYVTRQSYPHITQLIASYKVGKLTRDVHLCRSLFPCDNGININSEQNIEARQFSCKQMGKLCPGVSITCGLCAILSPESCGAICPVAAIYCGTSGYACAIELANNDSTEEIDNADEAEEDEEEEETTIEEIEDAQQVETEDEENTNIAENEGENEARTAKLINNIAKKITENVASTKRGLDLDENKTSEDNDKLSTFQWKEDIHSQED